MTTIKYQLYLHGNKESAWEAAEEAGFSEEQIKDWDLQYAGYEVPVTVAVNTDTGDWTTECSE